MDLPGSHIYIYSSLPSWLYQDPLVLFHTCKNCWYLGVVLLVEIAQEWNVFLIFFFRWNQIINVFKYVEKIKCENVLILPNFILKDNTLFQRWPLVFCTEAWISTDQNDSFLKNNNAARQKRSCTDFSCCLCRPRILNFHGCFVFL